MEEAPVLAVGESYHLRMGKGKGWIMYAGMPSEDVYSVVRRKKTSGYQIFTWRS